MTTIHIRYGVGFGMHADEIEVDDDETDEEISRQVEEAVTQRLDWGWLRQGE